MVRLYMEHPTVLVAPANRYRCRDNHICILAAAKKGRSDKEADEPFLLLLRPGRNKQS